ncbi:uncharacterized protein [Asterias amurensis]|uniref:uncharacterized protein n=1 Tax=Asterias amurensis TaxID=7602 RepID=UPI003AB58ED7
MAPNSSGNVVDTAAESPARIEMNDLDETLPPCRECERHFFARNSTFNVFDAAVVLISMLTFAADIVTDGLAASQYFIHGEPGWGCLTLGFTLAPSIIMQVFSIRWYLADEDMTRWRWIFHSCLLGPLERYVTVFETGLEARRSKDPIDFERLHHQQSDVSMLRLFEAFLESAPQIVLQLYIMVATNDENLFTGVSGMVSLFSLCWAVVAYSRAHRRVRTDKKVVSWPGVVLQTIWRIGMVSSRVVALVLFASAFKAYTFIVVGIHWLVMVLWVFLQKTDFCDTWLEERLFNCVIGTIYVFCFFNLKEGNTRYRISIFYIVVAIENVVLLLLWHRFGMLDDWYTSVGFTIVFGGFLIGTVTMVLYYRFFHPRGAISLCGKSKHDIGKACRHGKSNRLSLHHGNVDAEIFHRSRTPSPQKSPAGADSDRGVDNQGLVRAAPPCNYSPLKGDPHSVDGRVAPSHRSKSLGCLFASESECEGSNTLRGNTKSLEWLEEAGLQTTPTHLNSEYMDSPGVCTCSFQAYELSGFATELVDRFDKRKDMMLAQSLLADESRMSLYSAAGKQGTPCKACLDFNLSRVSQMNSSRQRGRSFSQPNPQLIAKETQHGANPKCSVRFNDSADNHIQAMYRKAPKAETETLEISQVSCDLPELPQCIDSPDMTGAMNAFEVQKIYDQILGREPLQRVSKRQLNFGEVTSNCDSEDVQKHSGHSQVIRKTFDKKGINVQDDAEISGSNIPQRPPCMSEPFKKPTTPKHNTNEPVHSNFDLKPTQFTPTKSERYDNHSSTNIAQPSTESKSPGTNPKQAVRETPVLTSNPSKCSPGTSDTGNPGTSDTGNLGTSDTGNLGTSDTGNPGTSDNCNPGTCETGNYANLNSQVHGKDLAKCSSLRKVRDGSISGSEQTEPQPSKAALKPGCALGVVVSLHLQGESTINPDHEPKLALTPALQSSELVNLPVNIINTVTSSANPLHPSATRSNKTPQPSHSKHFLADETGNGKNRDARLEEKHSSQAVLDATPRKSQLTTPLTPSKAPGPLTQSDGGDYKSNSRTQNKHDTLALENQKRPLNPMINTANTPSPGSKILTSRRLETEPKTSILTTPHKSTDRVTVGPGGKENKQLTPLSARLALLSPSSAVSPAPQKKPPRKSLGRIPTNKVAKNVALFGK